MLPFEIVVMTILCVGTLIFGLYVAESDQTPNQPNHDSIEDAWRIQEIANNARQEMYREATRHGRAGDE